MWLIIVLYSLAFLVVLSNAFTNVGVTRKYRQHVKLNMAPFKSLPWNVKKEKEREARRLKIESAQLHRELGIAEDATFEEITQATDALIRKANGDVKRKIKIEIAKDRIMQIRLNERLAGITTPTEEAKAQSRLEEEDLEDDDDELMEKKKKKKEWSLPKWADGIIVKPDAAYRNRQIKVFGTMTLLCFVLPPMSESIMFINWAFAAGQIGRRGMGEPDADYNPYMGRRGKPHQRTAVLLMLALWLVSRIFVASLGNVKNIFGPRYVTVIEASIMNVIFGIATAYLQTYKPK